MRRPLKLHPHSVCNVAAGIEVEIARPAGGSLFLSYTVTGAIGDLLLPPIAAPARTDELWRHTCFEAFVMDAAGEGYYEFNLAPSTQWAAYRFDRYRSGMHAATEIEPPQIVLRSATGSLYVTCGTIAAGPAARSHFARWPCRSDRGKKRQHFLIGRWRIRPVRRIFITPMGSRSSFPKDRRLLIGSRRLASEADVGADIF